MSLYSVRATLNDAWKKFRQLPSIDFGEWETELMVSLRKGVQMADVRSQFGN